MAVDQRDPEELTPEEAREHLIRLIASDELERHEELYRKLEQE
ncbi:MAG: hypothetical protein U5K37_08515 [Natrialbaceae archaeon]|nr:hypothetical protein [Natrialbaceae archaeon]